MTAAPESAELLALLINGLTAADRLNRALINHNARRFPNDVPSSEVERAMSVWETAREKLPSNEAIAARLAATPPDPDTLNEQRAIEDAKLASNVREACAKIAEPWPGFWLDENSTDADRAVVAVRIEIAEKIRAGRP